MHMSAQASAKNSKPAARANAAAAKKLKLEEKQAAGEFKRLVEEAKNGRTSTCVMCFSLLISAGPQEKEGRRTRQASKQRSRKTWRPYAVLSLNDVSE